MALLNKTGITNGSAIEAEHVTRTIDALTGGSTDTVIASGSFTGSLTGLANSASFAISASHLIGGTAVPAGTVSGSAQLIELGAAITGSSVIFTNASASFISASKEIHAQEAYRIAGGFTLAAGLPLGSSVDIYVGPASQGKLNFQATNTKVDNPFTASSHISASGTVTMATASIGGGVFTSASLAGAIAGGGGGGVPSGTVSGSAQLIGLGVAFTGSAANTTASNAVNAATASTVVAENVLQNNYYELLISDDSSWASSPLTSEVKKNNKLSFNPNRGSLRVSGSMGGFVYMGLNGEITASGHISASGIITSNTASHELIRSNTNGEAVKLAYVSANGASSSFLETSDRIILEVNPGGKQLSVNRSGIQFVGDITASGHISASNTVFGVTGSFSHLQGNSPFTVGDQVTFQQPITASGNISASGNLTALDLNLFGGDIDLKNAGAQSNIKFYCESANAHYTKLQAAPHSAYSGNTTLTLSAYDFDFAAPNFQAPVTASIYKGDGSGLTNLQRPITSSAVNFTASATNAGYYFRTGGNVTCSIQTNANVAIATGTEYELFQTASAGNLLIETGSASVTVNSKGGNKQLTGQFSAATLKKVGTDEWDLIGDLG